MLDFFIFNLTSTTGKFAYSHLENKQVYGHQVVVSLLSCDGLRLPYSIDIYDKNHMSKIELSENLIKSLPKPVKNGVVLYDSWYSSKDIFKASKSVEFNFNWCYKNK